MTQRKITVGLLNSWGSLESNWKFDPKTGNYHIKNKFPRKESKQIKRERREKRCPEEFGLVFRAHLIKENYHPSRVAQLVAYQLVTLEVGSLNPSKGEDFFCI